MAVLQVLHEATVGGVYLLGSDRTVIGRHPECDIVVDAEAISRQHAAVLRLNDAFYIEDLNSQNGTYVNGELLRERRKLLESDHVQICDVHFEFYCGDAPSSGAEQLLKDDRVMQVEPLEEQSDNLPTATMSAHNAQTNTISVNGKSQTSVVEQWACRRQETIRTPKDLVELLAELVLIPCVTLFLTHSFRATSIVFFLALLHVAWRVFSSLYWDNCNLQVISDGRAADIAKKALPYWCPVLVVMLPAVMIVLTVDVLLDRAIDLIEVYAYELSDLSQGELQSRVTALNSLSRPWYHYVWPPTLVAIAADEIKLKILNSALAVAPSIGFISRAFFAVLHAILAVMQVVTLSILFLLLLRSFCHVLFRVWLRDSTNSIEFRLITADETRQSPDHG